MTKNIEIYLKDIGYLELQTKDIDNFGIPLVFNIDDIEDITKRKSGYSKTIKVLGTKNNNKLFQFVYEIKAIDTFKLNYKYPAVLLVNKNPIISGFIILKKIEKLKVGSSYQNVYSITIQDEVKNFFDEIGELNLSDLDFSSSWSYGRNSYIPGDHTMNDTIVPASFSNDFEDIYKYGFISHADIADLYTTDWNTGTNKISLNHTVMQPMVFTKAIFDRICYEAGVEYSSDYLDGTSFDGYFSSLVEAYNGDNLVDTTLGEFVVETDTSGIGGTAGIDGWEYSGPLQGASETVNLDISPTYTSLMNNIDWLGYQIADLAATESGVEGIKFTDDNAEGTYRFTFKIHVLADDSGYSKVDCTNGAQSSYRIRRIRDGDNTIIKTYETNATPNGGTAGDINLGMNTLAEFDMEVEKNDFYYLQIKSGWYTDDWGGYSCIRHYITVSWTGASLVASKQNNESTTGTTKSIVIGDILPDMTQKDFIKNQLLLANLYITYDSENDTYKIDPPADFYGNGTIIEWTDKVDYHEKIKIEQGGNNFEFKYQIADERGIQWFLEQYGIEFGNLEVIDNVDWSTNTVELDYENYFVFRDVDEVLQSLYTRQLTMDGVEQPYTRYSPAVNYYSPKYSSDKPIMGFLMDSNSTAYFGGYYSSGVTNTLVTYPVFTNFTDETVAKSVYFEFNIQFNPPGMLHETAYELFYEDIVTNYNDENSRLVEIYVELTIEDILKLNFANRILINNQLYLLRKLQYDPSKNISSKITLQKQIIGFEDDGVFTYEYLKTNNTDYFDINEATGADRIHIN